MGQSPLPTGWSSDQQRACLLAIVILLAVVCLCGALAIVAGGGLWDRLFGQSSQEETAQPAPWPADSAELTVAVSPGMAPVLEELAGQFNRQQQRTPDDKVMAVRTLALAPQKMVEQSLATPPFQALAPDSSLWLNQLEQRWADLQDTGADESAVIPIANRRAGSPVRYATSPVVIAAWERVLRRRRPDPGADTRGSHRPADAGIRAGRGGHRPLLR